MLSQHCRSLVGHQWEAIMANSLAVKSLFAAQSSVNSGSATQTPIIHVGFKHTNLTRANGPYNQH